MPESNEKLAKIFENIIYIAIPAYVYISCFAYEFAWCRYYKISYTLISISVSQLLVFGGVWFVFSALIFFIHIFYSMFVDSTGIKFESKWWVRSILSIALLLTLYYYGHLGLIKTGLAFIAIVSLAYLPPLFGQKRFWKRWYQIQEEKPEITKEDLKEQMNQEFKFFGFNKSKIRLLQIAVLYGPLLSFTAGIICARARTFYPILQKANKEYIMLKKYDDLLICKPFRENSKEICDTLVVEKVKDDLPLVFVYKEISGNFK